ncbi:MAG TPA: ferredoxin [Candidatus Atribacteria bacterium]|jgi:ferredoxin|nr:ferredoxin [Candidatus Atribacteria bacterium]
MVRIDKNNCVGCGICVNICPQGFKMVNRKAIIEDENASCIAEAANSCPQGAIILEENKNLEEASARQAFRPGFINAIGSSFRRGRNFGTGGPISRGHRGNRGQGKGRR